MLAKAARARERADMREKAKGGIRETVRAGEKNYRPSRLQEVISTHDNSPKGSISSIDL